jgi:hypothetical protein
VIPIAMARGAITAIFGLLALALVATTAGSGCRGATSSDVARWQTDPQGVPKLVEALLEERTPPWIAAEAAQALALLGRTEDLARALALLSPQRRHLVFVYLTYSTLAHTLQAGPASSTLAARDGLLDLRPLAPPDARLQIDRLLLDAVRRSLSAGRRDEGGRYSMVQVLRALGPPATDYLLELLTDEPHLSDRAARLLAETVDGSARERVGRALVSKAATTQSNPAELWRALGLIGGRAATAFLGQIVERGSEPDAPFAARMLRLGPAHPEVVSLALRLAGDRATKETVREELFLLLSKMGTPEARRGVLRFLQRSRTSAFRRRAFAAALEMDPDALAPALEALGSARVLPRDDIDACVRYILRLGPDVIPTLQEAARSASGGARLASILALEALAATPREYALGVLEGVPSKR